MIKNTIKKSLIMDKKNIEYVDKYTCAGFQDTSFTAKVNDIIDYNNNLLKVAIEEFKTMFTKEELLYVVASCFNSAIYYKISARDFVMTEIRDTDKFEFAYDGDISILLSKIEKLTDTQALLLYLACKQTKEDENGLPISIFN